MEPTDITAELEVAFEKDGVRRNGRVYIGRPYPIAPGGWRCAVGVEPLYKQLPDMPGSNALHALCKALWLLQRRLNAFTDTGGHIYVKSDRQNEADEREFNYGSYFGFALPDPSDS